MNATDIEFDAILDMNDPQFAEKLRAAIGAEPGETIEVHTPQFERTDGLTVPKPLIDFTKLPSLFEETLKAIGCQKWDEPDNDGNILWLYPAEWYDHIPEGHVMRCIDGNDYPFKRGETDDDMRFGALAYGFLRKATP
ncbi:hypothetical protein LB545_07535 [Mesorhizobium sp. BR1-1-6]|uniref:hypothetical protein n=1 Tax=Mesorhizobium sp. BR1-1-6 TaxID=2876648 RepID=UPI001CD164FF|nr:hypothetical protein [Mesorhizobium sp. BR1-1-6]MBZ9894194.1 hypothetical protein [Mesorhizobium sp. BR1-1-6]